MPVQWSRNVVKSDNGKHAYLRYEQRAHHITQLLENARRWPDREHLVHGDRRLTFGEVDAYSSRVALALQERGIGRGDQVMMLAANSIEWVVSFWAIVKAEAVFVSANGWWSKSEVDHAVSLVTPKLVIADQKQAAKLDPEIACWLVDDVRSELENAGTATWDGPDLVATDENDLAIILFTSGSTGAPKGVMLSHRSQIANQQNLMLARGQMPDEIREEDTGAVTLLSSPLFHIAGVQLIMTSALIGGVIVMTEGRFDAGQVLDLIETEKVERWGAIPTMLIRILDHPDLAVANTDSLQVLSTGGTFIAPEFVDRVRDAFPNLRDKIGVVYGLSEGGGTFCALGGPEYVKRPKSAGRAFPVVEMKIDNPDEDGIGEIIVRSPSNMDGYFSNPDDETIDADGFLHTGDTGYLDGDGFLYVTGRIKDLIIRGGENIAPANIETTLRDYPNVQDVAVIGIPSEEWGEEVGAVIISQKVDDLDEAALSAFCHEKLSHFEVPTLWWVRPDQLPTTDSGKVTKPMLKKEWAAHFGL